MRRRRRTHGRSPRAPLVTTVDVNAVLHNVEHGGRTVVDARAPDRFRGENETIDPVGGHIPGAKNRFFKDNLQADGRFKAPAQLKAELGAVAVGDPRKPSCSAAPA
jgi:thiosulfate/3-mercaptopyruvate sulfurtransferase